MLRFHHIAEARRATGAERRVRVFPSVVTILVVDYIIFAVGTSGLLRPALALAESGA